MRSVEDYMSSIEHPRKKADSEWLLKTMSELTGKKAVMWGEHIVGFDQYHYKYESGREGDFFKVGFAARKTSLTVHIMPGFQRFESIMNRLGKFKTGKSCLYINKLDDVDREVLRELIKTTYDYMDAKYPS